jgi:hypothetical protein
MSRDIAEFVMHVNRFDPETLVMGGSSGFIDEMMSFALVFLISKSGVNVSFRSDEASDARKEQLKAFVKNPYLISKLVEVLFSFTWDYGSGSQLQFHCRNVFATQPLAIRYLPQGLIAFWVGTNTVKL